MKIRVVVVAVVSVVLIAGVWAWRTGRLGHRTPPAPFETLYGNVEIREVELGFRVAGRLGTESFDEGQSVTAGTVMARLDAQPYQDALRIAEADVSAQEANLRKAIVGARPAEIARARAAVDEAVAADHNARLTLARTEHLVAEGAVASAVLDDARAAARMAEARLDGFSDAHRLLVQGTRAEDIALARAALRGAQARQAAAQTALEDTRLVAPSDGVVTSRVREPGAIVSPVDVVYVLTLNGTVWVRAYLSETQLGRVHPGMPVWVSTDAAPGRPLPGRVGFVSPTAEFTPRSVETPDLRTELVYRIRVLVDAPGTGLQQGMPVTIRLPTRGG